MHRFRAEGEAIWYSMDSSEPEDMEKNCSFGHLWGDAKLGGVVGSALVSLHHFQHALLDRIPEDVSTHILVELTLGAASGATLFVVGAAIGRWFKRVG